ncbi:MAG: SPFH domain-containing protein [candidate division Zixibacteria bacterium]|nr:SPFH domain-containing protein [candidate division Zixibacteria bacterium]
MKERELKVITGWVPLALLILALAGLIYWAAIAIELTKIVPAILILFDLFLLGGLFMVNPNEGRVLQLFGKYVGTARMEGLRWANPLYAKRRISLRVRNFETNRLKVNDIDGNPIEIAAIVVWKVVDTAEATFQVDNYENFVKIQSESAVRNLATQHPYDSHTENRVSLRGHTGTIAEQLKTEIHERLAQAGVEVIEARISHLAYAPEIAEAMLRRQQAGAVVAARQLIVEGAVGMVEMALEQLAKKNIIELDHEKKAAMVSNLLVVLCGESASQPVINTGTLYQ